jgi:hypothetical protein
MHEKHFFSAPLHPASFLLDFHSHFKSRSKYRLYSIAYFVVVSQERKEFQDCDQNVLLRCFLFQNFLTCARAKLIEPRCMRYTYAFARERESEAVATLFLIHAHERATLSIFFFPFTALSSAAAAAAAEMLQVYKMFRPWQ